MIVKRRGKFVLMTKDGTRVLGTHDTKSDAYKQEYAIKKSMNDGGQVPPDGKYMFFGVFPEQAKAPEGYKYTEGLDLVPEDWSEFHEEAGALDLDSMVDRQMGVESSYLPGRTSSAGATGLAQFTPIAQKEVVRLGIMPEGWDPNDPKQAREAMYGYMENLYDREWVHAEDSDPIVAYAKAAFAYNAGEGTAIKELNRLKEAGYDVYNSLDWIKGINKESREYIEQVAGLDTEKGRQFEKDWPTFDSRRQKIFGEQS